MKNPCEKCTSHWSAGRNTSCLDSCKKYKDWKNYDQARKSLTLKELWQVIRKINPKIQETLPDDANVVLSLRYAAILCFIHRLEGLEVEIIRYQLYHLQKKGIFDLRDDV